MRIKAASPIAPGVQSIVARQVLRWNEAEKIRGPQTSKPCIAISRLPHARAAELGQRVADRLDYGFLGKEILDQIENEQGIRRQLTEGLDEHVRGVLDRFVIDTFTSKSITESEYATHLVRIISTLGQRGMAVILGRGAPFILPPERALRVLVVAPADFRANRLASKKNISIEEARDILPREDHERHAFIHHHFEIDENDPSLYDLVVNTSTLSMDIAVDLVLSAMRDRFGVRAAD